MDDDLPPRRHPADPPWWHWEYVNVRGWARMRRRGPLVFGLVAGGGFVAFQLAVRLLDPRWAYAQGSVGGTIFVGTFVTFVQWRWMDRRSRTATSATTEARTGSRATTARS